MRWTTCIGIANYNLLHRKKYTVHLLLNLTILASSFVVWLVLASALLSAHDKYLYGEASQNCVGFDLKIEDGLIVHDSEYDAMKYAESIEETGSAVRYQELDLTDYLKKENWSYVNVKRVTMDIGGTVYQGINDYSYDFETPFKRNELEATYSVRFKVATADSEQFYTENELTEYIYHYGRQYPDAMICGSSVLGEKELVISDYLLERFGIADHYEELLGKMVTIYCEDEVVLENYEITGVVDSRLFRVDALGSHPQVIVGGSRELYQEYQLEYIYARVPIYDFGDSEKVYNLLEVKGYQRGFFGMAIAEYYDVIADARTIVQKLVGMFGSLIFMAIAINLFNVLGGAIEERSNYFGILKANGMIKMPLYIIAYTELFEITAVATLISVLVAKIVLGIFDNMMYNAISMELTLTLRQYGVIALIAHVVICVVIFLMELPMLRKTFSEQPSTLLKR